MYNIGELFSTIINYRESKKMPQVFLHPEAKPYRLDQIWCNHYGPLVVLTGPFAEAKPFAASMLAEALSDIAALYMERDKPIQNAINLCRNTFIDIAGELEYTLHVDGQLYPHGRLYI